MLDNRLARVTTKEGLFVLGMLFTGPNAEADANAEAARRDAAAGYKLSPLDLVVGVPRDRFRDDRTEFERVSQSAWSPVFDKSDDGDPDTNPWRRPDIGAIKVAAGLATESQSRREFLKAAEREIDEKAEHEAFLAEDKASPERAAAIRFATDWWRQISFDKNQPLSAVVLAEQIKIQASTPGASLSALKTMSEAAVEQQRTILAERRDKASQDRLAATAAFDAASVEPTSFLGTPGIAPGDRVSKMLGVSGVSYDVVTSTGVLKASYPADTASPEIKALADQQS